MKSTHFIFPLILFSFMIIGCHNNKIVELPLTPVDGYGSFSAYKKSVSTYSEDDNGNNPWVNTYVKVTKYPNSLTDIKTGHIETNIFQTIYQNHIKGTTPKGWYKHLQKAWTWTPDTLNLSKEPIKTQIAFAVGKDRNGATRIVIDANNNLDLSDDQIYPILDLSQLNTSSNPDSLTMSSLVNVEYEKLENNQIVKATARLFIATNPIRGNYLTNFAQYATTKYKGETIAVISNNFTDLSYSKPAITILNNTLQPNQGKANKELVAQNEFINIDGEFYKNLGVNLNKNCLILERETLSQEDLISTQIGFKSPSVEGTIFNTDATISSETLRGKFYLLYFWSSTCGACKGEFPILNTLYEKTSREKFEIVGIACSSSPKSIEQTIDQYSLDWPQIVTNTSTIQTSYGVASYPTIYLIDPNGVVIAKDLRGKRLEDAILGLF